MTSSQLTMQFRVNNMISGIIIFLLRTIILQILESNNFITP